ncbi:MAG: hypothetical protein A2W99_06500 [Bacteroidetes bacterium GWF2_33_16]|nr:MAG: hypothetical protein A2X00_11190 [Bacteroidetes bacterium GWE2_32_14]OFY05328.1 MAG: hypothetical protein A2W99_06500 [Bacteroidetes bacterium GWF2_33_16]
MINFNESAIDQMIVHKIGKKHQDENIQFSKSPLVLNDEIKELLNRYFLSPFKSDEYFHFFHESDLGLNEVYHYVEKIFASPQTFYDQSVNLAKHLYEQSTHPNINAGEFYIVYFKNFEFNYEITDAIGLFKSETRDTFLKVYPKGDNFAIESDQGIDIKKLDKGCLILNQEKEKGFVVATVDKLNKGDDARYWVDDFLKIKQREDNFFQTGQVIKMYKEFVVNTLPDQYQITKADQAEMLNKSKKFFKENDNFEIGEFAEKIFEQPEIIDSFNKYRSNYESENDVHLSTEFEISDSAVRKQSKAFKSVIKLDKNFHIYVHGNRDFIVKGFDEKTGMNFYQVFFRNEL